MSMKLVFWRVSVLSLRKQKVKGATQADMHQPLTSSASVWKFLLEESFSLRLQLGGWGITKPDSSGPWISNFVWIRQSHEEVYVRMCTCVCRRQCTRVCVGGGLMEARRDAWMFLRPCPPILFKKGSLAVLKVTRWTGPVGHWDPGTHLSPLP